MSDCLSPFINQEPTLKLVFSYICTYITTYIFVSHFVYPKHFLSYRSDKRKFKPCCHSILSSSNFCVISIRQTKEIRCHDEIEADLVGAWAMVEAKEAVLEAEHLSIKNSTNLSLKYSMFSLKSKKK